MIGGTAAAVPPPFRPGNPDLCGSHPLVAPYYCRLGDLLCFLFTCMIIVFFCYLCNVCVPSVLWYCWLGLLTRKNRRPYNLYCVGGDVKPCSINLNDCIAIHVTAWQRYRVTNYDKKAQLTLSNPRDVKACQNCSNSTCFVSFHRIPFPQIAAVSLYSVRL